MDALVLKRFSWSQFELLFQNSALQLKCLTDLRINLVKVLQSSLTAPDAVTRRSIDLLSRHIRLLGKFFRRVQQLDIPRFVALPMCSSVIMFYWDKVVEATNSPPGMIAGMVHNSSTEVSS